MDEIYKNKSKEELVELVYTLTLQNTNGRESNDEMYLKGIEACYEELCEGETNHENSGLNIPVVSFSLICLDTKHYTNITKGKKYSEFKNPNCNYNSRRFIYVTNDKGQPKAYYKSCFKQIYES